MNSKLIILSLAILIIQLINASILKDENSILETSNVSLKKLSIFTEEINQKIADKKTKKFIDTISLSFSKFKIIEDGDKEEPQLICITHDHDQKKLCDRYQGSVAQCTNLNYKKEDQPNFQCKLAGMKVINENVVLVSAQIGCKGMTAEHRFEYDLPAVCQLGYMLGTKDGYDEKDDFKVRSPVL